MITFRNIFCFAFFLAAFALANPASAQLHSDFTATPLTGCPPMVVSFSDNSTGSPVTWKWDLGNGTVSYLQNPVATYFSPGKYTIKLVISNTSGTDSIVKSRYIEVYSLPQPKFGVSDSTGCFPLKVNFIDSSTTLSGTITSWQWDFGDGNLSSLQNPQHTYTSAGNYTVILKVVNSNGCTKTITKTALIKTQTGVKAGFSYSSVQGCSTPTPVTFNNTSTGSGTLTYLWNFGDGSTSASQSPVHNYQNGGSYTITLIVKNSTGCADTLIKPNAVNIGFVKAVMSVPDTVCVGQPFDAINTSNPSTFIGTTWTFGEGTIGNTPVFSMNYINPGTYTVKMITDFGSCSDSVSKQIVVLAKPVANFIAANFTGCTAPLTVSFTNTSAGAVSYLWDFGDSATSTAMNPVHTYTTAGSYTVTLTIKSAGGCEDKIVKNNAVIIAPPHILKIDSLPAKGCLPFSIFPSVIMQDSVAVTSYKWLFGDGATSTAANPTHTYTTAGVYDVTVIVTTGPGCTDTLKLKEAVKAGNKPNIHFSATPRDACASTSIMFSDLSTMNNTDSLTEWYWTFGDGGSSTDQNPTYIYNDTGYFNVTLIGSNYGCSDTLKIENYMHLIPPIAIFDTAFFCNEPMKRRFIDKSIGANTWSWNFGDGSTSTLQNPAHTYADTGVYRVSLKVTNGACTFTKTMPVPIVNEHATLTVTDTASCIRTRITFRLSDINRNNIQSYIWLPEGLGQDSTVNTVYAFAQYYNTAGTRIMAVVLQDILNCRDTLFAPAPIRTYGSKANFSSSARSICFGSNINFYDSSRTDGIHPIVEWKWNFGDTIQSYNNSGTFSHFYSTQGLYNVTLQVTDTYGCKDSITKPGFISISKPVARFFPSDTLLCPTSAVTFNNQSQGTGALYSWNFGDGNTSQEVSPSHTYSQPGSYIVKLSVTDKNGCSDSSWVTVHVFTAKALFNLSDSFSTCPPLVVNITNQSSNYVNFSWDFGDGGNSQLVNPSHIYTYPGNYTVKLTVFNNGGCTDSMTKKVTILGPTGDFDYVPKTICNPGEIQYSLISNNTIKYIWDFDDGTTIFTTSSTAKHTYTTPGVYLPKIILEDAGGCRVPVVGLDTVKVIGIETNILSDNRTICDSGFISFRDSTIANDLTAGLMWTFGDGDTTSQVNPVHHYTHTGTYTVTLVANSNFGCKDTAIQANYIKVSASPKVKIIGDTAACEPAKIKFSGQILVSDTSAITWSWNFGNGQVSNLPVPDSQSYSAPGTYTVNVKATSSSGCFDNAVKTAVIHPRPIVYAGMDTAICRFTTYNLNASGADSFVWSPNPALSCTRCPNPIVKPDSAATYVVTGISAFGCINKDSVTVGVKQPFKMTVGKGDTICIGKTVQLSASGAEKYEWIPYTFLDDHSSATPVSHPDSSINYKVIGSDKANCFKDTGRVRIKVYPYPTVNITNGHDINVIVGNTVHLTTTASADVTAYVWNPGELLSCGSCPDPVASPKNNIAYTVNVKNAGNCEASDKVTITMLCNDGNVFVPNTFSPNGDGANDIFYPRGRGVNAIKNFTIFNRWGQVVYQRSHVNANDPQFGWDGTMNGVKMPTDVYVYLLEVICANNVIFPIKGNVSLMR